VATVIKLKRGTSIPTTSDIVDGEVAINTSSKKFYINDSGTIKEVGGQAAASDSVASLTDTTVTDLVTGQVLFYNGTAWVNEFDFNTKGRVPFIKADATITSISMVNNKNMTTINGFLDHVVAPSFYLSFTNAAGSAVTTLRPGHMPELSEI
jgi:hypothetical protein|tara:strand:+ start:13117 stop:13572 length:456 start_codon:yes stop_codon:yes gene_type:complete